MPRGGTPTGRPRGRPPKIPVEQAQARQSTAPANDHVCTTCNKIFASSTSLEAHQRVHTGKLNEQPTKRRAAAPASAMPEAKRTRVQVETDASTSPGTRSSPRRLKCKFCEETFLDRSEWAAHMRQRHSSQTPASSADVGDTGERMTRRSTGGGLFRTSESQPSSGSKKGGIFSTSTIPTPTIRSRNATLRFEEELADGNVQCRECQSVFNNRRGLAAHVSQKHRDELENEQAAIDEEYSQQRLRRSDQSRMTVQGLPPSIPRQASPHRSQMAAASIQDSVYGSPPHSGTLRSQLPVQPRRTTLQILTQPAASAPSSSVASRIRGSGSQKISRGNDHGEEPVTESRAPRERRIERGSARLEASEDHMDESVYEFSTEVTVDQSAAAAANQQAEEAPLDVEPPLLSPAQDEPDKRAAPAAPAYERQASSQDVDSDLEIDNYPCKFCKSRVFLTSYGLERHTKMSHPDQLEKVLRDIQKLHVDKNKRVTVSALSPHEHSAYEGSSGIDSHGHHDYQITGEGIGAGLRRVARQPSSGPSGAPFQNSVMLKRRPQPSVVDKENESLVGSSLSDSGDIMQLARQQSAAMIAGASFTDNRLGIRLRRPQQDVQRAKYQSCDICGILINTEHPKAMESHTKAHQKNQELRMAMLHKHGLSWVERVTCRECNLVFKDEDKLEQHRRNVHVRRRHFLCRFCGDVFRNMRDLNAHKERRHEAYEGHRRSIDPSSSPPPPMHRAIGQLDTRRYDALSTNGTEEFACRSTCEICGQQMIRPSNLIRHMKQAHDRTNFTATVETRGMPPFKIDVYEGRFMWGCCNEVFDDRQTFTNHRRLAHGRNYVSSPKECELCGLTFKNNVSHANHLRTHRSRLCNICGESFGNAVADLILFHAHMIRHKEQGYTVRLPTIEEELAAREQQELSRAIAEEEEDESEDEYSIFSESGVESDIEDDSEPEDVLEMTCPVCEKNFSCMNRFSIHWRFHCRSEAVKSVNFVTKPFSYKTKTPQFNCWLCRKSFKYRQCLALHRTVCSKLRRGFVPEDEHNASFAVSPSKKSVSAAASPVKPPAGVLSREGLKSPPVRDRADASLELEDQLDVCGKAKKHEPDYIEKAYVVEWDTNKAPPEDPYTCSNCKQTFGDFLSLIMHVKSHIVHPVDEKGANNESVSNTDDNDTYGEEKVTASVLRIRTSDTEALGKYPCHVCGRSFKQLNNLNKHLDTHRPKKTNRCRMCGRRFWTASALQKHSRRHDPTKHYCLICDKKFKNGETLANHEAAHSLQTSLYQCEDCDQSFYGLVQLHTHFKETHPGVSILTCPICSRIHTDMPAMREHMDTDHAKVRTKCRICSKVFHTPHEARCHRRRMHIENGIFEKCTLCGKKFFDKRSLSVHLWRHTGTKGHQCRVCDASFESAEDVRTHLETVHSIGWLNSQDLIVDTFVVFGTAEDNLEQVDKCFSCYVCGKKFGDKTLVREHAASAHKRSKKFSCASCGTKFSKPWLLTSHEGLRHGYRLRNTAQVIQEQENKVNADNQTVQALLRGMQLPGIQSQDLPVEVAQLLMNQGHFGNVRYVSGNEVQMVADEATAAAVMAAAAASGVSAQDYQVLIVGGDDDDEDVQYVQETAIDFGQLQRHDVLASLRGHQAETQPMEIDETNYQQFLNQ